MALHSWAEGGPWLEHSCSLSTLGTQCRLADFAHQLGAFARSSPPGVFGRTRGSEIWLRSRAEQAYTTQRSGRGTSGLRRSADSAGRRS